MVPVVRWLKDNKGSTTILSLFFVAIFVVTLYMSAEIWKVVSIKKSLHSATYQAVKYISLNGMKWGLSSRRWEEEVRPLIVSELANNPFLPSDGPGVPEPDIVVWLSDEVNMQNYCEKGYFRLKVELSHQVLTPPKWGEPRDPPRLPMQLKLAQTIDGQIECYP